MSKNFKPQLLNRAVVFGIEILEGRSEKCDLEILCGDLLVEHQAFAFY